MDDQIEQIQLTTDEWNSLVEAYIVANCYPVTVRLMEERLVAGESINDMLVDLIRNDAVNQVLAQAIKTESAK